MELSSYCFKFEIRFPLAAAATVWASKLGLRSNFNAPEQFRTFNTSSAYLVLVSFLHPLLQNFWGHKSCVIEM